MSDGLENARLSRVEREDCPAEFLEAYDEVIRSRGRTSIMLVRPRERITSS